MENKKIYIAPEIEILEFETEDILDESRVYNPFGKPDDSSNWDF